MVDMLESETGTNLTALAVRGTLDIEAAFAPDRTFLIKKMEINFQCTGGLETSTTPGQVSELQAYLVFFHDSGAAGGSIAAALNAGLQDKELHNDIIWMMPFLVRPQIVDTDAAWALAGLGFAAMRTKSFPKGYPLDKDETYVWGLFNPRSSAWFLPLSTAPNAQLRIRYWGVYL